MSVSNIYKVQFLVIILTHRFQKMCTKEYSANELNIFLIEKEHEKYTEIRNICQNAHFGEMKTCVSDNQTRFVRAHNQYITYSGCIFVEVVFMLMSFELEFKTVFFFVV